MNEELRKRLLDQLDVVIQSVGDLEANSGEHGARYYTRKSMSHFVAAALALVERVSGANSIYMEQVRERTTKGYYNAETVGSGKVDEVLGVLLALRRDVAAGYLDSLPELIHAEVFSDFLAQAAHLHEEGYKDAAAVMAGSVLESHLRQLCIKNAINIEAVTSTGSRPKTGAILNADLYRANVYSNLDQQSVTTWLALRNQAAHGSYGNYTSEQVALLIQSIRDFISRNPA